MKTKPFPLKKYYLLYAGFGGIIFYIILFAFFINAERQALYNQYIDHLTEKATALYNDIDRDFFKVEGITFEDININNRSYIKKLRKEIDEIISSDFTLAKVKIFNRSGLILYDHSNQSNEGKIYDSINETGFQTALTGKSSFKMENDEGNKRFMELYLPVFKTKTKDVVGILELYEDVSRFEVTVFRALKQALLVPTAIFILFNLALFLIIVKADRIISDDTELLINIRHNMEKYISSSAVNAIYSAVTLKKELFKGEMQNIIVFFSDVRGFTSYSEKNTPETVVGQLNTLFEIQADIIHSHGGTIDKFVGDEIMAVFPFDKAHDAAKAALEIVSAINDDDDTVFEVGIGIHTGEAVVGSIGTKDRRDYTAIGNTVNTGARLCSASSSGEVIVSSEVFDMLGNELGKRFTSEKRLQLKGKSKPVKVYSSITKSS
jgi:class 3 adenylate cyclase